MKLQSTRAPPQEIVRKRIRSHRSKRASLLERLSKDDRVEIDIDELKDRLGLKDIVSSVEEMKALFQEVQRGIVKATQPILTLSEDALVALKVQEKIDPGTIVPKLADSVNFVSR